MAMTTTDPHLAWHAAAEDVRRCLDDDPGNRFADDAGADLYRAWSSLQGKIAETPAATLDGVWCQLHQVERHLEDCAPTAREHAALGNAVAAIARLAQEEREALGCPGARVEFARGAAEVLLGMAERAADEAWRTYGVGLPAPMAA